MLRTYYEFFAGGGMARAGLGSEWQCSFANDFDEKKCRSYAHNWGHAHLFMGDIGDLSIQSMPGRADLAWASFPCQDLSLAGAGAGLRGGRSGAFWSLISHLRNLDLEGRMPALVVLENVLGTLSSNKGADFQAILRALNELGYSYGAVVIDAAHFLPQSRPRLFIIAFKGSRFILDQRRGEAPCLPWCPAKLVNAYDNLSDELKAKWIWWTLPQPRKERVNLSDVVEDEPQSVSWHSEKETSSLLAMMSKANKAKVMDAVQAGSRVVGALYKRTRYEDGVKVQRAEVRFDGVAGCLRTPAGGSSRQLILVVEGDRIGSRLLSSRETARLMGLPDSYRLPENYNEAYQLTGDGVAVPVVQFLSENLLKKLVPIEVKQQLAA